MSENKPSDKELIRQLMSRLDEEYRLRKSAESIAGELADATSMKESYERKLTEKDKQIGKQKATIEMQKEEICQKDDFIKKALKSKNAEINKAKADAQNIAKAKDKTIKEKESEIRILNQRLDYLMRKVWGSMSERRKTPDDPRQLMIDFGAMELTDEEQKDVQQAVEAVKDMRKVQVKAHEKLVPVRRTLPENLHRVEEHKYPEG